MGKSDTKDGDTFTITIYMLWANITHIFEYLGRKSGPRIPLKTYRSDLDIFRSRKRKVVLRFTSLRSSRNYNFFDKL